MPGRQSHSPLAVILNGRQVGVLTRRSNGAIEFAYDDAWLDWSHAMPVSLSIPLSDEIFRGATVSAVFENLLPDSRLVRQRVAERVGADGTDAFSMLGKIGRDCIGALQFLPMGVEPTNSGVIEGEEISTRALGALLSNLDRAPLGLGADADFRISVAGAQEKTALLFHEGRWIRPHGTTPTSHIIKPQIGHVNTASGAVDLSNSVENEHYCLRLLAAFGIDVAATRIAKFAGVTALVVERFDRRWTSDGRLLRVPQEDLCQSLAVPPTRKYQNEGGPGIVAIAEVLRGSDRPLVDVPTLFKSQILFWLIGATDGHAKNFSIFLKPGGGFELTPIYDVVSLQPSVAERQLRLKDFKLAMAIGASPHYRVQDIHGRHFVETGRKMGLSIEAVRSVFGQVHDQFGDAFGAVAGVLPRPASHIHGSVHAGAEQRLRMLQE
ncbi:MAG TPA: type II toxin-antitoxin system HipA family toxin [Sphingomicrobium sp.]|nr:type II toxin-antitoxin system HipA family toxin [Sphingomicrobium sp.]